jgi:PAS domain-containing protein
MDQESKRMLDDLPLGVYVARVPDGEVAHVNRAFRDLVGPSGLQECRIGDEPASYRVRDREGRPFPAERLPLSMVLETGTTAVVDEMVICRADGKKVHVRATGHPVRNAAGQLTHVMITFIDNTREIEAEVARAALAERLRCTVEHAPIVLFCVDRDGIATLSEGAGLKALGLRPGDHVGMSVFDVYKDHPTVPALIRRALPQHRPNTGRHHRGQRRARRRRSLPHRAAGRTQRGGRGSAARVGSTPPAGEGWSRPGDR